MTAPTVPDLLGVEAARDAILSDVVAVFVQGAEGFLVLHPQDVAGRHQAVTHLLGQCHQERLGQPQRMLLVVDVEDVDE